MLNKNIFANNFLIMFQPYTIVNERNGRNTKYHSNGVNNHPPRAASVLSRGSGYDNGSDIYVTSGAYKAPSEIR